jgi:predicted membrane channel-forming protein YqfA (hemolysin III family)
MGLSAGFNLLAKLFGWLVTEEKKVVMGRNKLTATLRCIVHLVPISAAIALLILNGSNHYIGGELSGANQQDSQNLGALLFAANLHELLMLASKRHNHHVHSERIGVWKWHSVRYCVLSNSVQGPHLSLVTGTLGYSISQMGK